MHVVAGCSDRVIALDHGVKIAEGGFDEVREPIPPSSRPNMGRDPEALAEPGMSAPLLSLENVTTYYAQMRILEGNLAAGRRGRAWSACWAATRPASRRR